MLKETPARADDVDERSYVEVPEAKWLVDTVKLLQGENSARLTNISFEHSHTMRRFKVPTLSLYC